MSANKHTKYTQVIGPLFKKEGAGIGNDVNILVDRLRGLHYSRLTGDVHDNDDEMKHIIEQLLENEVIFDDDVTQ